MSVAAQLEQQNTVPQIAQISNTEILGKVSKQQKTLDIIFAL